MMEPAPGSMRAAFVRGAVLALLAGSAAGLLAQPQIPDAGRLLQETRPAPATPQRTAPDVRIEEPAAAPADHGPRIRVSRVRITGATVIQEGELHALVADAEGKELTLGELRALADRISQHYRTRGYLLTRAYVPAQDVTEGTVQIAVVEGRLGEVAVDNRAALGGAALAPLDRLRAGGVAQGRDLERELLLMSELPGVEVKSTLRPGATPGASDLLVEVTPGPRWTGSVEADNYGDRYSGRYRAGGTLNLNNPLRLGDQATLRAIASDEGMRYLRGSYQLPVSSSGTRVGIAVSAMRYRLGKELAPLGARGDARVASAYALHPSCAAAHSTSTRNCSSTTSGWRTRSTRRPPGRAQARQLDAGPCRRCAGRPARREQLLLRLHARRRGARSGHPRTRRTHRTH